jgi:hypothetical protein
MGFLRRFFFRLTSSTRERKASRSHLKAAKNEDREQYLSLVANYIELAQVYFGSSVSEPEDKRIARVEQVFLGLWQHLRYAERLSDFEYMLASALIENAPETAAINSTEPLVTKLRLLSPKTRFAFIAYKFEGWPLRWVTLVMRLRTNALHRLLSEARCELCGVSWESLTDEERDCLVAISASLNASPNLRANKVLSKRIRNYPRVSEIRAQWLELRPQLVEVRHRYMPRQEERERILKNIFAEIEAASMTRPPFVDRVVNTVHFSRHRKIKVS